MSKLVSAGSKHTDEDRRRAVIECHIKGNDQAVVSVQPLKGNQAQENSEEVKQSFNTGG